MSHVLSETKEPRTKAILNLSGDKGTYLVPRNNSLNGFLRAEGVNATSQNDFLSRAPKQSDFKWHRSYKNLKKP